MKDVRYYSYYFDNYCTSILYTFNGPRKLISLFPITPFNQSDNVNLIYLVHFDKWSLANKELCVLFRLTQALSSL